MKRWERSVAVIAALVALALNVAASVELFIPPSTFGYSLVYTDGYRVASVDPQTAASRAGIVVGDRLDFTQSSLHDRIIGLEYQPPRLGERVSFDVRSTSHPSTKFIPSGVEGLGVTTVALTRVIRRAISGLPNPNGGAIQFLRDW